MTDTDWYGLIQTGEPQQKMMVNTYGECVRVACAPRRQWVFGRMQSCAPSFQVHARHACIMKPQGCVSPTIAPSVHPFTEIPPMKRTGKSKQIMNQNQKGFSAENHSHRANYALFALQWPAPRACQASARAVGLDLAGHRRVGEHLELAAALLRWRARCTHGLHGPRPTPAAVGATHGSTARRTSARAGKSTAGLRSQHVTVAGSRALIAGCAARSRTEGANRDPQLAGEPHPGRCRNAVAKLAKKPGFCREDSLLGQGVANSSRGASFVSFWCTVILWVLPASVGQAKC